MNVYEKLSHARMRFQELNVKPSGKNQHMKFEYFQLDEILPAINKLAVEIGFIVEVSFSDTLATLIFRDVSKPEDSIIFTSPMSTAALKGCHEVQNLGAVQTYIKRYLYQNAFEIVEHDSLDGDIKPDSSVRPKEAAEDPDKIELAEIMNKKFPDGSPYFTEEAKAEFRKMFKVSTTKNILDAARKAMMEIEEKLF